MFIDVSDDGTDNQTRDRGTGIQSTDLGRAGVAKILVPGIEGLETGNDTVLVYTSQSVTR